MKLYLSPSACSLAPHIVLRETGIPFESEVVVLKTKTTKSGLNYLAINPKGYVPALELDNGQILTEVATILLYLSDAAPAAQLGPPPGKDLLRYRLHEWLTFVSSEIHKAYSPLFDSAAPESYKEKIKERLSGRLAYVEAQLGHGPFLMGEHFSVVDAYLFTVVGWSRFVKLDLSLHPKLEAYLARIKERPTVRAALDFEKAAR